MAKGPRERFERELERVRDVQEEAVRLALLDFADALDPEVAHDDVPVVRHDRVVKRESKSTSTARCYTSALRAAHDRGLDILEVDVDTVNAFMADLVTPPERRRHDLVEYDDHVKNSTASNYQAGLTCFYRWATEPGAIEDRPDVEISWPVDGIHAYSADSSSLDSSEFPDTDDLDALREACLASRNTRRDRAFLEVAAGTGQRIYAIVTLLVGDVHLDADQPHVMLNPEIEDDGDKGAISAGGRWRPIVTDTGPIREWINAHPLRDEDTRAAVGAPERFDDCYLFVGDPDARSTDLSSFWSSSAANDMLQRRAAYTRRTSTLPDVDVDVNPHNWRHYAYSRSQDVPGLDEPTRRKVFGWVPGSDQGEDIYGHEAGRKAGERFAALWEDHYGAADAPAVAEQLVGDAASVDLAPEARRAIVRELLADEETKELIAKEIGASLE